MTLMELAQVVKDFNGMDKGLSRGIKHVLLPAVVRKRYE